MIDVSSRRPPDSFAAARAAQLSTPQSLQPVLESSYAWWRDHWEVSSVSFDTKSELGARLEAFYRGSSYLLAASSRSGQVAPGLYGPWVTTDHPMWGGDWHMVSRHNVAGIGFRSRNLDCILLEMPAIFVRTGLQHAGDVLRGFGE